MIYKLAITHTPNLSLRRSPSRLVSVPEKKKRGIRSPLYRKIETEVGKVKREEIGQGEREGEKKEKRESNVARA